MTQASQAYAPLAGLPVIVGSGLAGLMTAIELSPTPCVLVTGGELGVECASDWAQGGLAAAVGPDDDPDLHAWDTLAAGAGLCDERVVRRVTAEAPAAVRRMLALGARLDRTPHGRLDLGLEGAHSRHRIVHAAGDGSGHELTRAAVAAVRSMRTVTLLEHTRAIRLLTGDDGAITGLVLEGPDGLGVLATGSAVLATGGSGALHRHTTNPRGARGTGLALALRAGAAVRDLEMVQFHPTALDVGQDPMPLVSEAVRGHGTHLVDQDGRRVVDNDLAPRDVVSRAVWAALDRARRVFLDTPRSLGATFPHHFPTVTVACLAAGIDPVTQPLPVRPAAHYQMGGVVVDDDGRSTVRGLWAVGEVASTGLHGANRLASNSLLEAVVCARWVADSVRAQAGARGTSDGGEPRLPDDANRLRAATAADPVTRQVLDECAGVLRDHRGLSRAVNTLADGAVDNDMRLVGLVLAWSALRRTESRGGHTRTDHPDRRPAEHTTVTLESVLTSLDHAVLAERSA